jgi:exonuclease VII small subunit
MKELGDIVADVPLEESISVYTRSEAHKARCDELVRHAEARIKMSTLGADGKLPRAAPLGADI